MCQWVGSADPTNLLLLRKSCILSQPRKLAHGTTFEGFVACLANMERR